MITSAASAIFLRDGSLKARYYASGGSPRALRGRLCGEHQGAAPPGPPICMAIGELRCFGDALPLLVYGFRWVMSFFTNSGGWYII